MSQRFFSSTPIESSRCEIDGTEAHHLLHVMRAGEGDQVTLFDGSGWEFEAKIVATGRRVVELEIESRAEVDRELASRVVLAIALPKGDRQKWLVEKLTELGVAMLVPLQTERSVAQPTGKALERLTRTVIEASKQCRRNRLLEIGSPLHFADLVGAHESARPIFDRFESPPYRGIAHPGMSDGAQPMAHQSIRQLASQPGIIALIGPEGGFSDAEVSLAADHQWHTIDLGSRILRIETAAIAIAAQMSAGGAATSLG